MGSHVLLRCYAAIVTVLVATYLAWPYELRSWPFLAVTSTAVPAVLVALRRAPAGSRAPWWLMLAAMVLYNTGNVIWIWLTTVGGRPNGDGGFADVLFTAAGALLLAGALLVVRLRSRGDIGGVIDSVITAVALGGVLWDAVLLPVNTAHHLPPTQQIAAFLDLLAVSGTLGAMLRVSRNSVAGRSASVRLLAAGIALTLAGKVMAPLVTGVDGMRPDWTNVIYLAAYAALGCAALHPSVATMLSGTPAPDDDLTRGRLTFLGTMLALTPLVGGGRAMLGLPVDGELIALSSAALVPLVMIRIARLAAQRRAAEQALHHLATRDALTGLPNRAACLDALAVALPAATAGAPATAVLPAAGSPAPGDHLTVLFCDLDGFKPVNDRLGHSAGDELLVAVADRLRGCVREGDLVSRFGGDEFVLVCHGPGAVTAVSDRIAAMATEPFAAGGEQVRIGISVGAAEARPADTVDHLVRRADLAMYEAKKTKQVGRLSLVLAA
ncbi:GGDEF domain-containing protein [Actinoplanes oblitus]|uniref:GGDEF domain-containing protein n=1 Tax=Actinoplanes oblitus TaxID=3040509 RepID=A0ABY8W8G5_9ACTN|nr:GGDEF domain-containing protein [Actinoplanes oblitus]WIM94164.1 GGDEF domain-containing protein [Actinoplanes oblitus]